MYPSLRSFSMMPSLSCRRPSRSLVFSRSCSHAGVPVVLFVVTLAPSERQPLQAVRSIMSAVTTLLGRPPCRKVSMSSTAWAPMLESAQPAMWPV